MRRLFRKAAIWALLVTFILPQSSFAGDAEDQAAILQVWQMYQEARVAGDAEIWLDLWDDDGIQMPPGIPARGIDAMRVGVPKAFAAMPASAMVIQPEEIVVPYDWAYGRGTYSADRLVDGAERHIEGKFLTILKRQGDGSWKNYRDIFNDNPQ